MSRRITRLHQLEVPEVEPGQSILLPIQVETTGEPEEEWAKVEAIINDGSRVARLFSPWQGWGFVEHPNNRDGHLDFWALKRGDTWQPRLEVTLECGPGLQGLGAQTLGELTYYTHDGERGVSIPLTVTLKPIPDIPVPVDSTVMATWQDVSTLGWIYSYDVCFELEHERVETWEVSFTVPQGTRIYKHPWADVTVDEITGVIKITKPIKREAGLREIPINIAFQLLYPPELGQDPALDTLKNLKAHYVS